MAKMAGFRVTKAHLVDHLLSDVIFLCSFVLSCPLYFGYFVFLLPYVLRLVAVLYPLVVTVLLVLVALCIGVVDEESLSATGVDGCGCRVGYLAVLCDSVVDRWRRGGNCHRNGELECLQDFGMFEMLFGSSVMEVEGSAEVLVESLVEAPPATAQISDSSDHGGGKSEDLVGDKVELNSSPCSKAENSCAGVEEKRLENFLKILDQFERMASNVEEKKIPVQLKCTKSNKVVDKRKAELAARNGSEATFDDKVNAKVSVGSSSNGDEKQDSSSFSSSSLIRANSQRIIDPRNGTLKAENADEDKGGKDMTTAVISQPADHYSLGTYGSMRKEKEWKRTLACKLFEERHNVGGGEGMDSLWEAYEMDSNKAATTKPKPKPKSEKNKHKKKSEVESYYSPEEDQEEEEADDRQQLCCLQAFKLSTGKMNLGMGRPNLVKITKAIKGIGWLHQVTKHSKKVHNNGDRY